MIVKIQRPLDTNDTIDLALVYNQSRTYTAHIDMTTVAHLFKDDEQKIYHKARLSRTEGIESLESKQQSFLISLTEHTVSPAPENVKRKLVIGKRVEARSW